MFGDDRLPQRFWDKVRISPSSYKGAFCWEWTACCRGGYGLFRQGKMVQAHRLAYTKLRKKIPKGLQIDHLCEVRHCVNPDHLEAVTQTENVLRGGSPAAKNAKKTLCPQGHPYSGGNLYIDKHGRRQCKTCTKERGRRSQERRKLGMLEEANRSKTQCPQGHPYSGDNVYICPKGGRRCRTCQRSSVKRSAEKYKKPLGLRPRGSV